MNIISYKADTLFQFILVHLSLIYFFIFLSGKEALDYFKEDPALFDVVRLFFILILFLLFLKVYIMVSFHAYMLTMHCSIFYGCLHINEMIYPKDILNLMDPLFMLSVLMN